MLPHLFHENALFECIYSPACGKINVVVFSMRARAGGSVDAAFVGGSFNRVNHSATGAVRIGR